MILVDTGGERKTYNIEQLQHVGLKTAIFINSQQMLCTHGVGGPAINRVHAELIVKCLHCW